MDINVFSNGIPNYLAAFFYCYNFKLDTFTKRWQNLTGIETRATEPGIIFRKNFPAKTENHSWKPTRRRISKFY